jgi:MacB-like periplasmic core domain
VWRRIFHRAVQDEDIAEELESHLAIEVARLMEDGLSREEAERQARRAFGNVGLIRETTREAWGSVWLERLSQDLRYGVRTLRRSPGFTIATILSLALGIGASTAIFSLVDTVFLRPLPYVDWNRLVWAAIRFPSMKAEFVPSPDFVAWRRDNQVFEHLSAVQADGSATVILSDPVATEVHASRVSFNFLSTFGVSPLLGRSFRPEEELPDGPKTVLLTNRFWRDHFHSDQRVIGRAVRLDGQQYTIVGVLPADFVFPMDG